MLVEKTEYLTVRGLGLFVNTDYGLSGYLLTVSQLKLENCLEFNMSNPGKILSNTTSNIENKQKV